jgi:flagellar assembly factor FliW
MQIRTTHFGVVQIAVSDIFQFPHGLIGFEDHRRWVLLADESNDAVGWLQSAAKSDLALPVISPRRLLPDYRFHLHSEQLSPLKLEQGEKLFVLNIVSQNEGDLTANLKAPVIVNLDRRLVCQVTATEDHPLRHVLGSRSTPRRKIA